MFGELFLLSSCFCIPGSLFCTCHGYQCWGRKRLKKSAANPYTKDFAAIFNLVFLYNVTLTGNLIDEFSLKRSAQTPQSGMVCQSNSLEYTGNFHLIENPILLLFRHPLRSLPALVAAPSLSWRM